MKHKHEDTYFPPEQQAAYDELLRQWKERFRQMLGFLLLAAAGWYLWRWLHGNSVLIGILGVLLAATELSAILLTRRFRKKLKDIPELQPDAVSPELWQQWSEQDALYKRDQERCRTIQTAIVILLGPLPDLLKLPNRLKILLGGIALSACFGVMVWYRKTHTPPASPETRFFAETGRWVAVISLLEIAAMLASLLPYLPIILSLAKEGSL